MEALAAERLPFAPVNTLAEALADPQAAARGMVARIPLPDGGTCPASGNPIKLSGAGPDTYTAPPLLGQHTREVLAGVLGYDEARVARLLESGAFTAAADRAPGHGPPPGGGARPGSPEKGGAAGTTEARTDCEAATRCGPTAGAGGAASNAAAPGAATCPGPAFPGTGA